MTSTSTSPDLPHPVGARRTTRRRAETRARLLDAAFLVFAEKGFGHVRIEDVCSAAGYTRGAFYSQFESLDELFFTLYDARVQIIANQVAAALFDGGAAASDEELLDRVSSTLLMDRDWLLVKTDFMLHAARNPGVAEKLATHRAQLRAVIEDRLRAAHERLALSSAISEIPDAARAVVAAYDGVTYQLLLDADVSGARAWLKQLLTALLKR